MFPDPRVVTLTGVEADPGDPGRYRPRPGLVRKAARRTNRLMLTWVVVLNTMAIGAVGLIVAELMGAL